MVELPQCTHCDALYRGWSDSDGSGITAAKEPEQHKKLPSAAFEGEGCLSSKTAVLPPQSTARALQRQKAAPARQVIDRGGGRFVKLDQIRCGGAPRVRLLVADNSGGL